MSQLYLQEYARALAGRRVCVACREGILRDHLAAIVADVKFLVRKGITTTLFHNLPLRFANQKLIRELEKKLPETTLVRIGPETDFYTEVLAHPDSHYKVLFLERRFLIDPQGNKVNALNTERMRRTLDLYGDSIGNINFRAALNRICEQIEAGLCERVHILPAGKGSIKTELFSVEGAGTMIANNFEEEFRLLGSDEELAMISRILASYKKAGFLKPRGKEYLKAHRDKFYVTLIDGIVVGCVELKEIDEETVELGALAISTRFRNQRVGVFTVNAFIAEMAAKGYTRFISLTRNPRLEALFVQLDFSLCSSPRYLRRQRQSPDSRLYLRCLRP